MIDNKLLHRVFKVSPIPTLVLLPDAPYFTIAEVNNAYLETTGANESNLIGKGFFETLINRPSDLICEDVTGLLKSLDAAIGTGKPQIMPTQRCEITSPHTNNCAIRYLDAENIPVIDGNGKVILISHTATDNTDKFLQQESSERSEKKTLLIQTRLEHARAELNRIMVSSRDIICTIDKTGNFIKLNAATEKILGYAPTELEGKPYLNLVYYEDHKKTIRAAAEVMRSGAETILQNRYVCKNGSLIPIVWSAVWDNTQNIMHCMGRDTTEKLQSEAALVESEIKYKNLFESHPSPIIIWDFETLEILDCNREALVKYDYTRDEFLQLTIRDIRPAEDIPLMEEVLKNVDVHDKIYKKAVRHKKKNGEFMSVEIIGHSLEYNGRQAKVVVVNDLSEKLKAEENNKFQAELLNTIGQAVIATDLHGLINFWNKAAEEMYGWTAEEAIGKTIYDFIPVEKSKIRAHDLMHELVKGGSWSGEFMVQKKSGTTFPVFVTDAPIYNEQQKLTGIVGVSTDISERKNIELQVTNSRRQQEIIYNTVSDIIFMVSVEDNNRFRYLSVNHTFLKATGLSKDQIVGQYVNQVIPESSLEMVLAKYHEAITDRKTISWEETSEYPAGLKTGLVTMSPVIDENGQCTMLVGSVHDITERKNADEEIKQSNQRYNYATKATSDAIWDWNLIDKTIQWGEGYQTLFGYNIEEVTTNVNSWTDHIHPEDIERVTVGIYKVTNGNGSNWEDEYRFRKTDQTYAYVADKGFVIRDEAGKALRMVGSMQDITKRKQGEFALQQSEARHRGIIASQTSYVIRTDMYGNYSYHNQKFIDDFGWIHNKTNLIGLSCLESVIEYHRERVIESVGKCMANMNEIVQVEIDKPSKIKGEVKTTLWDFICLSDSDGRPTEIQCVGIDISDRKLAEKAYINTLEEKNTILESIGDAFFAVDSDWTVTYWNNQAEKMLILTKKDMVGSNLWLGFSNRIDSHSYQKYHQAMETKKVVHFQDYDGPTAKWYEVSAYPSGSGLSVYFRDITEGKRSEIRLNKLNENLQKKAKELAVSNEELEQFAYVASHDLQEPLRTITSFLTLLEKKYGEIIDEKGKKYIDFAVDGAKRMRQIIFDLLEFSKVGKTEQKREDLDLNTLINEIELLCGKQIAEKNAVIYASQLPVINTYKAPLRQVFHNLIGNALKYTKKDNPPRISIIVEKLKDHWQFAVMDNGIGIAAEHLDKIFIIFQRLHNKSDFSGTGIGLAITKKIIENMGGKIWVESIEGKGSSFYFILPRT